jgi:beta-lactamase regulating signal transducer with metallopeptidase domain
MYFREGTAILNINKWFSLKIWDTVPVYLLFFVLISLTAVIFVLQEILPIIKERFSKQNYKFSSCINRDISPILDNLCKTLNIERPSIQVVDKPYPLLFTMGVKKFTIVLSNILLEKLNDEQLKSALTHEIVHMLRGSSIKTQIIYILRMLMFYNPVSLIEFRRLIQDDEFICDAITVSLTKDPEALISSIKTFYFQTEGDRMAGLSSAKDIIESHSYNMLLKERIRHLRERFKDEKQGSGWVRYFLTIIVILSINYMVV